MTIVVSLIFEGSEGLMVEVFKIACLDKLVGFLVLSV